MGSILGYAERELFKSLTPEQRVTFRSVVLDAMNGYHDSVLDLVKAEDDTYVRNDEVVTLLERVSGQLDRATSNGRRK